MDEMNKAKEALDTFNVDKVTWSAYDYHVWANINGQTIIKALELLDRVENGGDITKHQIVPFQDKGDAFCEGFNYAMHEMLERYVLIERDKS